MSTLAIVELVTEFGACGDSQVFSMSLTSYYFGSTEASLFVTIQSQLDCFNDARCNKVFDYA